MKVGIDTFGLEHGQSGLGLYLLYLMENLEYNENIEYELFGHEDDRYTYKTKFDCNFKSINIKDSYFAQKMFHKIFLPKFVKKQKYDCVMYFAATRMLPTKFNVKSIAIVNEIINLDEFSQSKSSTKHFNPKKILKSLKKIYKIVVPTEYLKKSLINLGIEQNKIIVIPHGIDHSLFFMQNLQDTTIADIKPFSIKKPYIIYPTRITNENKNHLALIDAFNIFKEKTSLPHRLVLSGSHDEYAKKVVQKVLSSPYSSDIFLTGFFSHKQLGALYSNAEICVFPSDIEGAGLPVIENMACGIPVICSDKGALPEITNNCSILFDSKNVTEIADDIEKIINDKDLYQNLSQKGLTRAKDFTWENTCKKIVELLLSI